MLKSKVSAFTNQSVRSDLFLSDIPARHLNLGCPSPKRYSPAGILANGFAILGVYSHPDFESTVSPRTSLSNDPKLCLLHVLHW